MKQVATVTPSPSAISVSSTPRKQPDSPPAAPASSADRTTVQADSLRATMQAVAQQIDSYLKTTGRQLEFSVDDASGRTVITVRNPDTGETIRQIPSEEALRLARALGSLPNSLIDLSI
ncbi:MAG TPA: flagellar protein FlaG [Steroidobacteraceae bacterium]|nr:flagellar protein FlaG [Steroidobacteraceae bacterium]